ncbi:MAG: hypothetical protein U0L68_06415 [Prevotellamassilia sp.]|nr:hypothetical protein [Prevotellamassilia sp.]
MKTKKATKTISIKAAMQSADKTLAKIEAERAQAAEPSNETKQAEATTTEAKHLTEKQVYARARRKALKDLCNTLQAAAKAAGMEEKPNELLREYYAQAGHNDLRTFDEWKQAGFYIRKGEKAILLWGHPKPSRQAKEAAKQAGKPEEEAENDFYPLAYLFSNKQVAPRQ